jgi:hypothetical protein
MEDTGSVPIIYIERTQEWLDIEHRWGETMGQRTEVANQSQFPNSAHFYPEDGVSIFSLNAGSHKPDYTAS